MNSSAIYEFLVKQGVPFVAGALSTAILGRGVKRLVLNTRKRSDETPPTDAAEEDWRAAIKLREEDLDPIRWLGNLERLGFFLSLWVSYPTAIGGWLAFKVASKWATYQNIVRFPDEIDGMPKLKWLGVRHRMGSNILQRFLLGTLGNVLCAAIGFGVGKGIQLLLS